MVLTRKSTQTCCNYAMVMMRVLWRRWDIGSAMGKVVQISSMAVVTMGFADDVGESRSFRRERRRRGAGVLGTMLLARPLGARIRRRRQKAVQASGGGMVCPLDSSPI